MSDRLQNPDNNQPIVGSVVLTAGDNITFYFSRAPQILLIAVVISAILATSIWLIALPARQYAEVLNNPLHGLRNWFANVFPIMLAYVGLVIAIPLFCSWLSHVRMPAGNRQLTYHADAEILRTSDATGAVLTLPWTLVKQTRVTPKQLVMQLTSRAWRFVPLRAFTANDQQRLIALAQQSAAKPSSGPSGS
jgi:hypothetical protein